MRVTFPQPRCVIMGVVVKYGGHFTLTCLELVLLLKWVLQSALLGTMFLSDMCLVKIRRKLEVRQVSNMEVYIYLCYTWMSEFLVRCELYKVSAFNLWSSERDVLAIHLCSQTAAFVSLQ